MGIRDIFEIKALSTPNIYFLCTRSGLHFIQVTLNQRKNMNFKHWPSIDGEDPKSQFPLFEDAIRCGIEYDKNKILVAV